MGGSSTQPKDLKGNRPKASSAIEQDRRVRLTDIGAYLLEIFTCMRSIEHKQNCKLNNGRIFHMTAKINKKIKEESNIDIQEEMRDLLHNKTVPLQAEINKRGITDRAWQIYRDLYQAYLTLIENEKNRVKDEVLRDKFYLGLLGGGRNEATGFLSLDFRRKRTKVDKIFE